MKTSPIIEVASILFWPIKWIVCLAGVYFLINFLWIIYVTIYCLSTYSINEQLQDTVDKNWSLERVLHGAANESGQEVHFSSGNMLTYRKTDSSEKWPIIAGSTLRDLHNNVYVYHADSSQVSPSNEVIIWNQNTYARIRTLTVLGALLTIISVGGLLFLLTMHILARFNLFDGFLRRSYVYVFFALSAIFVLAYWDCFPWSRDYTDTHTELLPLVKSNITELESLLDSADRSGLYSVQFLKDAGFAYVEPEKLILFPKRPQERNICGSYVFVSDGVSMPHRYVRINVDAYTYLFWAPEMSEEEVRALNANINFQHMGESIWLGKYDKRIDDIYLTVRHFRISFLAWMLIAIMSSYCLWKEKIQPKLRGRKSTDSPPTT